ncbi:MAG: type II secretion system protein GspG, partial [Hyphomonadaceae bacterium]|nr:type II secretion system protein GspG [Hyphomonadaceae bacterium]
RNLPQDPWNHPYQYVVPGERGAFDLYSLGADGRVGGEGLDADIGKAQ